VVAAYSNLTHPYKSTAELRQILEKACQGGRTADSGRSGVRALRRRLGDETIAQIVAAYKAGTPTTKLMAEHHISKAGILKLLSDAGVSMRRQALTVEQMSEAAELYRSGLPLAKVSEQPKLPHESIRRALVDAGVEMRPRGRPRS
jgi:hypothetical protein